MAASLLSLPAATARKTPALTRALAAVLVELEKEPPRDMLATVPLGQLRVLTSLTTKFMPAMTPELGLSALSFLEGKESHTWSPSPGR